MRMTVLGTGYVGLVSGACFAELGNTVTCVDIDSTKIEKLRNGVMPIYEVGLEEIVVRNVAAGRLLFASSLTQDIVDTEMIILAVGTPSSPDGSADLSYLLAGVVEIASKLTKPTVIVTKSTVPVGTAERIRELLKRHCPELAVTVASNPEFLREGVAVDDFLKPERVIVGLDDDSQRPLFEALYTPITDEEHPLLFMSTSSAELTKYASNAFLAAKISFINEVSRLAETAGADIREISQGMGLDSRIGKKFLNAGIGYGGSCFPKDVRALRYMMRQAGLQPQILDAVEAVNAEQKMLLATRLEETLGNLQGKHIAVWGLAFKPATDDARESAALSIIPHLLKSGAIVSAHDPKATPMAKRELPENVRFTETALDAATGADALLILTDWPEYASFDLKDLKQALAGTNIFDGRAIFDPAAAASAGLNWHGIGIPN